MATINLDEDRYIVNFSEDALSVQIVELITIGQATAPDTGSGDMVKEVYDPTMVGADVFDRMNHSGTQSADTIEETEMQMFVSSEQTQDWDTKADGEHGHMKDEVGLGFVDNTPDSEKPISTDTQNALDNKRDLSNNVFGTAGNTSEFESDGSLVMKGDATVWEDIQGSLIGRRLFSNQGTVDYNYEENTIIFSQSGDITDRNDRVIWNYQYPHSANLTGTLNLHIHYEQESATNYEFTVQYRIQDSGLNKVTTWTDVVVNTSAGNVFPYVSGTLNQICRLVDIPMTGHQISAQIQFRLTRTDSNGGTVEATFVDAHYERNTLGSNEEFIK